MNMVKIKHNYICLPCPAEIFWSQTVFLALGMLHFNLQLSC